MQNQSRRPDVNRSASPNDYAGDLRSWIFKTQAEAARYFGVHRATISKYERPDFADGVVRISPPIGYVAGLMCLYVEREATTPVETTQLRTYFLQQMQRFLEKYGSSYEYQRAFRDWDELCASAATYIERHAQRVENIDPPRDVSGPTGGDVPVPLPDGQPYLVPLLPPQGVVGRDEILKQIATLLEAGSSAEPNLPPVALRGMGGIGKTTLAITVGRSAEFVRAFPGGVLWVELGPRPQVRQLLTTWGDALGLDLLPERDEAACEARLRNALHNRRALLIVDDVWDVDAATHFMLAGPHSRTLVTTREMDIANALATSSRTLHVEVLSLPHALEMLSRIAPAATADMASAEKLCRRLECLPLGIRLAGHLLAGGSEIPSRMRRLIEELTERREARLRLMQPEKRIGLQEASLKAILGMSVERLSKDDQRRFAMLGVFGGEPLTWDMKAAAKVWQCTIEQAEDATQRLIARALVESRPGERYWMHALLADYAEEMLDEMAL